MTRHKTLFALLPLASSMVLALSISQSASANDMPTSQSTADKKAAATTRPSAVANRDNLSDLANLSLEELMNVEVTVAAKAD